jgi:hypothetical protein
VAGGRARLITVKKPGQKAFQPGTIYFDFPNGPLYQWAPRGGQRLDNFTWSSKTAGDCMAFGDDFDQDEWGQILDADVRLFEFKDLRSLTLWRITMDRALEFGKREWTPNGMRWLVPLDAFRVYDASKNSRGVLKREPKITSDA